MTGMTNWNGFTHVVSVIELCIAGYCLYRLVKPFLQRAGVAAAAGGTYFLAMLTLYAAPLSMDAFMAYAFGSLAAFLVMCGLERKNYTQKAFLAVTYFSLCWFTATMAELLYDKLYSFVENTVWYKGNPTMFMQFMVYVGVCVFYLAMVFAITVGAIRCITKSYIRKYEQMSKREMLMLVIPSFLGAVGYKIIRYYRGFYMRENGEPPLLYDVLLLFYCVVAVMVVVILIVFYQKIKAAQEEKLANRMLSGQIENVKGHIREVEALYRDIRGLKHDMGNHVTVLENLVEKKEWQEAAGYLSGLKEQLETSGMEIKSGNPVTDIILTEKRKEAEGKGIDFVCGFHYPQETKVDSFDVSVILNNALSNAIEAAGECGKPYVHIKSYRERNAYMIEVSNRFCGQLVLDEENGLPKSTKKEPEHGFGLVNIRKVAQKYFGDIDIEQDGDEVRLSVMLMVL